MTVPTIPPVTSSKNISRKSGPSCPLCPHSVLQLDSDWSEEDWDREIEKGKRKEKQRKEEEKEKKLQIEGPSYYPQELIYTPSYEQDEPQALVQNLMQDQPHILGEDKQKNAIEKEQTL